MSQKLTERFVKELEPRERIYQKNDAEVPGFNVRCLPSGRKVFTMQYYRRGRRMRYSLGKHGAITTHQARELARDAYLAILDGRDPQTERGERKRMQTVAEFLESNYRVHLAGTRDGLKTEQRIRRAFAEFMDVPLSAVTTWGIEQWRARRRRDVTARTVNRDLAAFGALLSKAVQVGLLADNPMKGLQALKTDKGTAIAYLSPEEERRLREALTRSRPYFQAMVLVALNCGLRRGELFDLRWRDIDLNRGVLTVVGATAKSEQTRRVELNDEAAHVLRQWRGANALNEARVFPGKGGRRLSAIVWPWRKLCARAGVKAKFKDLRSTFATRLIERGVHLAVIRDLMGHHSTTVTERYYAQVQTDARRRAVESLHVET